MLRFFFFLLLNRVRTRPIIPFFAHFARDAAAVVDIRREYVAKSKRSFFTVQYIVVASKRRKKKKNMIKNE